MTKVKKALSITATNCFMFYVMLPLCFIKETAGFIEETAIFFLTYSRKEAK